MNMTPLLGFDPFGYREDGHGSQTNRIVDGL